MTPREYTEAEINAALARVQAAKGRHRRGTGGELAEFGLRPSSFLGYAIDLARCNDARFAGEEPVVQRAGAWLDGLMVGIALAEAEAERLRRARSITTYGGDE